jgi:Polyketide cyclase / dehydrase and lipid transport
VRFSGTLNFVTQRPEIESVARIINANPKQIFAVLTDPKMHRVIDGSGAVRGCRGKPERLNLGSTFGMAMRVGLPYSMFNTVIEYVENRRIAWQTRGPTMIGKFVGGRIWRYELEPVDGGTSVRETWDITQESKLTKPLIRNAGASTKKNMATTLQRLDNLLTKSGKVE